MSRVSSSSDIHTCTGARHVPMRTCIGCRKKEPAHRLVRLGVDQSGRVLVDARNKMPGRGAWIHARPDCLHRGIRSDVLERAFKRKAIVEDSARFCEELLKETGFKD